MNRTQENRVGTKWLLVCFALFLAFLIGYNLGVAMTQPKIIVVDEPVREEVRCIIRGDPNIYKIKIYEGLEAINLTIINATEGLANISTWKIPEIPFLPVEQPFVIHQPKRRAYHNTRGR